MVADFKPQSYMDGHDSQAENLLVTAQVSIADAKARFAALVARAEAGEQIIVTRKGRPVACLVPLPREPHIKFGDLRGTYVAEDLSIPREILDQFDRK